jgi:hypothetical protein
LQFAHQVAGHEHRAALRGKRAHEAAQPDDPFWVHAVERLVEHQRRRVPEQRRRDAEPLPHAKRVAAGRAVGHRREPGDLEHLAGPFGGQALGKGQPSQMVAGGAAGLQRASVKQRPGVPHRVLERPVRFAVDERGA